LIHAALRATLLNHAAETIPTHVVVGVVPHVLTIAAAG
jgi:hypothetical protein